MNYELAKELREAGFPKPTFRVIIGDAENHTIIDEPTLSELIEACGVHIKLIGVDQHWEVTTHKIYETWFLGTTPEEAVARLYLQLKRHDIMGTNERSLSTDGGPQKSS